MMLTSEQVLALAPDRSSVAAARGLAAPRAWRSLGRSDDALWGECQGSALYQVRVDLSGPAWKCSCPSRKQPCKHALALMLLASAHPDVLTHATPPAWVADWLASRTRTAERPQKKPAAPPDPAAQARRAAQRFDRVREGIQGLDLWMQDLVRHGLATVDGAGRGPWEEQAARLVDAQAPALASRIRGLAYVPRSTADWAAELLGDLGRLALLTQAFGRLDVLPEPLAADVRQLVGWTLKEDEVVAAGDLVEDDWIVLGVWTDEDERFRTQRAYLRGARGARPAMVLQFAATGEPFADTLVAGTRFEAQLAFWPGAFPLRALVRERPSAATAVEGRLPGSASIASMLDDNAAALARQPWLGRLPCVLCDVVPARERDDTWWLIDRDRAALPLSERDGWPLAAIAGGHPIDVTAEWDGRVLRALYGRSPSDGETWTRPAR